MSFEEFVKVILEGSKKEITLVPQHLWNVRLKDETLKNLRKYRTDITALDTYLVLQIIKGLVQESFKWKDVNGHQ